MSQMKKNILLIFGGITAEYRESCGTAAAVLDAISKEKYNVYCIGISKTGEWILTDAKSSEIADSKLWMGSNGNRKAILSPDKTHKGILIVKDGNYELVHIDVAFPVIPGDLGEDGILPGLFEMAGIPYVGSGSCASVCSLDKAITMMFADSCGIKIPEFFVCDKHIFVEKPERVLENCVNFFESKTGYVFPLIVKPATGGSSVGVSKVSDGDELMEAMELAFQYSEQLLIEEYIESSDLEIAILEDENDIITGVTCEIISGKGKFYSNTIKNQYASIKHIPAHISKEQEKFVTEDALAIYKKLGCKGYARLEFLLAENGEVYFNEINTAPGLRHGALYLLSFENKGIMLEELIEVMIKNASV